jgi:hypothetical protein
MGTDTSKESSFAGGQLKIAINKDFYYESQVIEGDIFLDSRQNIIITDIALTLKQMECWLYKESDNNVFSEINNNVIHEQNANIKQILGSSSQNVALSSGSYRFPFKFYIPKNLQPSFEYPQKNRAAYIRYILSAELVSPQIKATASKYILIKSRPIVIQHQVRHEDEKNIWTMGIVPRGSCKIAVFTVSNNYRINDIIPITVDVYNENCKNDVKNIKISIKRVLTFVDKQKKAYKSEETFYRESYEVNVAAGTKNSFHYDIQLRDSELKGFSYNKQMNPYQNLEDLNLLMPTLKTSLIGCEYFIKVTAYFSIFTPHDCRPRVDLPLYVTAQTIDDYKAEERQMEIDNKKNMGNNYNYNNPGMGQQGGGNFGGFNNSSFGNNSVLGNNNVGNNNVGNSQMSNSQISFGYNPSVVKNENSGKFSYEMYRQKTMQNQQLNNQNNQGNFGNNQYGNNNNNYGGGNNQFNPYGNNNNYGGNNNNQFNPYGNNNYGGNNNNQFNPYGNNNYGGSNNNQFNPYGNNLNQNQNQNYGFGNNNQNFGNNQNYPNYNFNNNQNNAGNYPNMNSNYPSF